MSKLLNLSVEEQERVSRRIENAFEFVREILDDPTILDHISSGSTVESIPKDERDPDKHYDIETPRMVAIVTPPGDDSDGSLGAPARASSSEPKRTAQR